MRPNTDSVALVITTLPMPRSAGATRGPISTGETTTVSLRVWNDSTDPEVVTARINVPLGLTIDLTSLNASLGQAHYSVVERAITWSGTLPGSTGLTITFDATAASHAGQVEVVAQVNGVMRGNEVQLSTPIWINVDAPPRLTNLVGMLMKSFPFPVMSEVDMMNGSVFGAKAMRS